MAISTSTVAKNRIYRSVSPKSIFDSAKAQVTSAVSFNQGDLIAFDTSAHVLKAVTATGDAANLLGIARVSVVSGDLKSPYSGTAVDAAQAAGDIPGPEFGSVCTLKLKSGDAFTVGCKVYLADGADCQTVSVTDPGDHFPVGLYQGAALTAGATSEGPVLVGAQYGMAGLSF